MEKFKLIRTYEVRSKDIKTALTETKNLEHESVTITKIFDDKIHQFIQHYVSVKDILKEILKCLELVRQRYESKKFYPADTYLTQATALIELVELYDCGHTGGFGDRKYMLYSDIYHNIFARFLWLYEKYVSGETPDLSSSEISGEMSDFWRSC